MAFLLATVMCVFHRCAGGTLYGIEASETDNGSLESFDLSTGAKRIILNETCATAQSVACFDRIHSIWNIVCDTHPSDLYLMRFNVSSQRVLPDVPLPQIASSASATDAAIACVGHPDTGHVYLFGPSSTNEKDQLLLQISTDSAGIASIETVKLHFTSLHRASRLCPCV